MVVVTSLEYVVTSVAGHQGAAADAVGEVTGDRHGERSMESGNVA